VFIRLRHTCNMSVLDCQLRTMLRKFLLQRGGSLLCRVSLRLVDSLSWIVRHMAQLRVGEPREAEPQPPSSPLALFERRLHAPIHSSDAKWRSTIFSEGDLLRESYRHWRWTISSTIYTERVGPCRKATNCAKCCGGSAQCRRMWTGSNGVVNHQSADISFARCEKR
jgi:hypothetical protein